MDFEEVIQEALEWEHNTGDPGEAQRGLMHYYHTEDGVNEKVRSLFVTAEVMGGKLYGVARCEVRGTLTAQEMEKLKDYITGQYSDGFGEGAEQRPRATPWGSLYFHLWQDKGFSLRTRQEWEASRKPIRHHPPKLKRDKGGEAR